MSRVHFRVSCPIEDVIGDDYQYADRISRVYKVSERVYLLTIRGLGHWTYNYHSGICSRTCATNYRVECLKNKFREQELRLPYVHEVSA